MLVGVVLAGRRRAVQDRHDLLRCDGHPGQAAGEKLLSGDHAPDPRTKTPWLLGLRSSLLAGGIGLAVAVLMLLVGKPLISAVFGQQYLEAYDLIQIMLGAIIVSMMGFPQESLLFMAGKQRAFLIAQATASAAYIALLVSMAYAFGAGRRLRLFTGAMFRRSVIPDTDDRRLPQSLYVGAECAQRE